MRNTLKELIENIPDEAVQTAIELMKRLAKGKNHINLPADIDEYLANEKTITLQINTDYGGYTGHGQSGLGDNNYMQNTYDNPNINCENNLKVNMTASTEEWRLSSGNTLARAEIYFFSNSNVGENYNILQEASNAFLKLAEDRSNSRKIK